jgi:hypothetical protein
MSLFDTLKKVILRNPMGRPGTGATPPAHSGRPTTPATTTRAAPPPTAAQPSAAPVQPAPVDVEAVLEALSAKSSQKLNWRTSIVDLMKLVGLDSSLENRKELAAELGYSGDKNDSAAMNIWLHKAVMRKLAENGGKVPATLQ